MSQIGHNGGPSMAAGAGFRKVAWQKARAELLPSLPLQIVRLRVARAKRLGLPYKTYATIRATTGRDIVGFLFSSNALELTPRRITLPPVLAERLTTLPATRIAAAHSPLNPAALLATNPDQIDSSGPAPHMWQSWGHMRSDLRDLIREGGCPSDGVVLVAATALEREWSDAAGLAGTLSAEAFFAPPA